MPGRNYQRDNQEAFYKIIRVSAQPKILSDHKKIGKKFYPPAALYGMTEVNYVDRILPEIAWIGYFTQLFGGEIGSQKAVSFIETCFFLKDWGIKPEFSFCSNFRMFVANDWLLLHEKLRENGLAADVIMALTPFFHCYPNENPFSPLFSETSVTPPSIQEVDLARKVVAGIFNRRSQEASIVQSVVVQSALKVGKFHVPEGYPFLKFESLINDFESETANGMSSHVRMNVTQTYAFYEERMGESWANYFWNQGKNLKPLNVDNIPPRKKGKKLSPMGKFGLDYKRYAWRLVDEIWSKAPVDIFKSEFAEVMGALLARQCNLAAKIATNPGLWDFHAGPLFLRSMVDNYICLAWIMNDPVDRARKFILYGLGQEKLEVERLQSVVEKQDPEEREDFEQMISDKRMWIDRQHYSFLQYVDIGSWSGISTRKMAEEADCIELYNFAYTGWSHAVHGTWNHIGKFDVFPSSDPLHKYIRQPINFEHGGQGDVVEKATKYFDKLCNLIVEKFQISMTSPPPTDWFYERFEQLISELNDGQSQQANPQ